MEPNNFTLQWIELPCSDLVESILHEFMPAENIELCGQNTSFQQVPLLEGHVRYTGKVNNSNVLLYALSIIERLIDYRLYRFTSEQIL